MNDHERIIAMLANLTTQQSQQQAVMNDLQQKMIAMQIVINLMAANVEKTRIAALAAQQSAAAAQQSATAAQQSAANVPANGAAAQIASGWQSQLMTNVNILIADDKTLMADDNALQIKQTDIARRLFYTCLRVQGLANGIDAPSLNAGACTSTFWSGGPIPNWDTPFSH